MLGQQQTMHRAEVQDHVKACLEQHVHRDSNVIIESLVHKPRARASCRNCLRLGEIGLQDARPIKQTQTKLVTVLHWTAYSDVGLCAFLHSEAI